MIKLGEFQKLKVIRLSDLGYMLSDGEEEVLLHFKQASKEYKPEDNINVFIYSDKAGRKTATEQAPSITLDNPGFVKVTDVLPGAGVFVNINTPKDILISKDYLPYDETLWPIVGDEILAILKIKKDVLAAKPIGRYDIIALKRMVNYIEGEDVNAVVVRVGEKGLSLATHDPMYIFVPNTQLRGKHRLGESLKVTITKKIENEYYGRLNGQKEEMIEPDKKIILDYLDKHHGAMKITAKTSADVIEKELGLSRKAFKRAYGGLYKDRVIDFDEEKTFVVKK
ncbi:MAG: hypothetical protein K6F81_04165 [Acholeplasmatales bacterium]|nr:hypothetical protein [Acholeplasmatales bacterium]